MTPTSPTTTTIHLISHNHWDREWIFTARYANQWLPTFFRNLFNHLAAQPDYRFVLDGQMVIVEDYLQQLSAEEAATRERDIRRYVGNGQLQIGPAYLQPDWSLVSGEALVRNLLIGRQEAQAYGAIMPIGWLLDNFGQIAQAPQILHGFDIQAAFVWRGVAWPTDDVRTEFWWEAPDGTRILGLYLLDSYRNGMALSLTRQVAGARMVKHTQVLRRFASGPHVVLMNGYEQVPEPDDILPILAEFNQAHAPQFHAVQSIPQEVVEAILAGDPDLPVLGGYFYSGRYAPILKGVYSSRGYLNQHNAECQYELERWAETFNAMAWSLGFEYPEDRFREAWKTLLLNHTHDDMCGCCIDPIARDMEERFRSVLRTARVITAESLRAIVQAVATNHRSGYVVVLFNPSSHPRREVATLAGLDIPEDMTEVTVWDAEGGIVPHQPAGRLGRQLKLHVWLESVPAIGYQTVTITPGATPPVAHPTHPVVHADAAGRTLENAHLHIAIHPDGTFSLRDKERQRTYGPLGYLEDGGDGGDTYDYAYPPQDRLVSSRGRPAEIICEAEGPLLARFRVTFTLPLPTALTPDRQARCQEEREMPVTSTITLRADARQVEIETTLHNVVKDHRLRLLFPTNLHTTQARAGMPFDVAAFPITTHHKAPPPALDGVMLAGRYTVPVNTHPFQRFVSLVDDTDDAGLTLYSRGLNEYEVLAQETTLALTLIRGVSWLARADLPTRTGDVGPHILTPEAQCLRRHTFHYALYPHGRDWEAANPFRPAETHTLPLRAVQTNNHAGRLPARFSFLECRGETEADTVVVTALKQAEAGDGLILRCYNPWDRPVQSRLQVGGEVVAAGRVNLAEEAWQPLASSGGGILLQARAKEIVTLKVQLRPRRLIEDLQRHPARLLPMAQPLPLTLPAAGPPVLTEDEVADEQQRALELAQELQAIRSQAYMLNEALEQQGEANAAQRIALQRLKGREATLTRQQHEAQISALLNQHLWITHQMEQSLETLGEQLNWARVRKRVGEFLIHTYESLGLA